MLIGRKAWQRFGFARRTDKRLAEKPVFNTEFEKLADHELALNFDPKSQRHYPDHIKYAQVPAGGFKIDDSVMDRVKKFYIEKNIRITT